MPKSLAGRNPSEPDEAGLHGDGAPTSRVNPPRSNPGYKGRRPRRRFPLSSAAFSADSMHASACRRFAIPGTTRRLRGDDYGRERRAGSAARTRLRRAWCHGPPPRPDCPQARHATNPFALALMLKCSRQRPTAARHRLLRTSAYQFEPQARGGSVAYWNSREVTLTSTFFAQSDGASSSLTPNWRL
jgi:hypothetical protein